MNPGKGAMEAMRILFLAASPSDTSRLRLDEEMRTIDERLRYGDAGRTIDLSSFWAVRTADLAGALLRVEPHIVHFSGHGTTEGIVLEDASGRARVANPQAVADLLRILSDDIRCVVFNACFARNQAAAVAEHIGAVVGTTTAITDAGAISFAAGFYRAISYGRTIRTAFELGRNEVALHHRPDAATFQLIEGPSADLDTPIGGETEGDETPSSRTESIGGIAQTATGDRNIQIGTAGNVTIDPSGSD